jgi:tight adherence protein C
MNEAGPLLLVAASGCALAVPALRGYADIREALRFAEFERLRAPRCWRATRAFLGWCIGLPVYFAAAPLGAGAWGAALCAASLAYVVAPQFLREARRNAAHALLDELALHLDLIAVVVESGGRLTSALHACVERAPDGALRRAWGRALPELHAGAGVTETLRDLELRMGVRTFSTLVSAIRGAERSGADLGPVLRERATQASALRFAHAEKLARAAPLKLWATLMLCLAPCSLLVLAWPVARLLALIVG